MDNFIHVLNNNGFTSFIHVIDDNVLNLIFPAWEWIFFFFLFSRRRVDLKSGMEFKKWEENMGLESKTFNL